MGEALRCCSRLCPRRPALPSQPEQPSRPPPPSSTGPHSLSPPPPVAPDVRAPLFDCGASNPPFARPVGLSASNLSGRGSDEIRSVAVRRWQWAGRAIIRWIRIRRRWAYQGAALKRLPFRDLFTHLLSKYYGRKTWPGRPAFQIVAGLAWPNIIVNPAWPEERWDNDPGVPRSAYSATVQYSILITPRSIGRHRTSDAEPAERVGARRPSPQVARKCCRSGDRGAACSDDRGGRGVQVTGGAGPTIYTVQYSTYKASQHRTGQYSTVVQTGRFNTP